MGLFEKDNLRARVSNDAKRLIEKSLSAPDDVSETDRKKLDQLVQLVEIRDRFRAPMEHWTTLAILALSLIAVSLLIALRLERTKIELDVTVSEFEFTSAPQNDQVLTEAFNVTDITISGINQLTMPTLAEHSLETIPINTLEIKPLSVNCQNGLLSVGTLFMPGETQTTIKFLEKSGGYSFRFKNRPVDVKLSARGPIELRPLGGESRWIAYPIPTQLKVMSSSNDISLAISFSDKPAQKLNPRIEVTNLSFLSIEQYATPESTKSWKQSTLQEVLIYFDDLKGKKVSLRHGEQIRLDRAEGAIADLQLGPKNISFKFYGIVSGLKYGPQENPNDLMPTWLEYLQSNHILVLIWGSTASLFGLLFSIFRWIRGNR
jgi:hypothetical protein